MPARHVTVAAVAGPFGDVSHSAVHRDTHPVSIIAAKDDVGPGARLYDRHATRYALPAATPAVDSRRSRTAANFGHYYSLIVCSARNCRRVSLLRKTMTLWGEIRYLERDVMAPAGVRQVAWEVLIRFPISD